MPMKNPPHPGDFIRTEIIEAAGLTVTAAAIALGVSRPTLSSLLNGKAGLSGDMALRIEKAFGVKMDTLMRADGMIVLNAVTLDTLTKAVEFLEDHGYTVEAARLGLAEFRGVGEDRAAFGAVRDAPGVIAGQAAETDRKSTRLNSSHA